MDHIDHMIQSTGCCEEREGMSNCCSARVYNPEGRPDTATCMECGEPCEEV